MNFIQSSLIRKFSPFREILNYFTKFTKYGQVECIARCYLPYQVRTGRGRSYDPDSLPLR
jgi:hypothetical protein